MLYIQKGTFDGIYTTILHNEILKYRGRIFLCNECTLFVYIYVYVGGGVCSKAQTPLSISTTTDNIHF